MTISEIILISIGLAMDCFAVSVAGSIAYGKYNWKKIIRIAFFFGFFQGIMPFIGWLAGVSFSDWIAKYDHWFALIILCFLGIKMILGSFKNDENSIDNRTPYGSLKMLVLYAIATSIDALATGLIFVPLGNTIFYAMAIIAAGSFIFSILGCVIGISIGNKFKLNVEFIGGLILVCIGVKIFIEHTCGL